VQNRSFGKKIETLAKNPHLRKTKIMSDIQILVKNRNFNQKCQIWSNIEILLLVLVKNRFFFD